MNQFLRWAFWGVMMGMIPAGMAADAPKDYPIQPVPFTAVQIEDDFWLPRLETNRTVTVPYDFKKCEETGRIDNFAKAGGWMLGEFKGIRFDDSDVYKVIEGAAYTLAMHPDSHLDAYLDNLIAKIGAAQEEDGYLYTTRTINPRNPARDAGPERWSFLKQSHELYNVGHMYEAAVAHYMATGKRTFLDIAIKNANLVDRVFGPGKKLDVPGHEEIEIGLAKLYRATGDERYLKLAKFFLDERGNSNRKELYGKYNQDYMPVVEQTEAVGHSVRAGYLYTGMADIAALTGDPSYIHAIDTIWENVVSKKMYLTGGIGSRRSGEEFGDDYELPNKTAYNETCAAIANALWNYRLFLLHGDSKYIDVLERILYNGFLSGVSLQGNTFFYPNPLECDGIYKFNQGGLERSPWFDCSCCPTNDVRFIASIPGFVYAVCDDVMYVNLYAGGTATVSMAQGKVHLRQETRYPWDGRVSIQVTPEKAAEFSVLVRIPGWAQGRPVPSDLYHYVDSNVPEITLTVNGLLVPIQLENGYVRIQRTWSAGDEILLDLPMPIHRVLCNEKVQENLGRVAVERGPVVYCAEWIDNGGHALDLALADSEPLEVREYPYLLGGVTAIRGKNLFLIPYYAWNHRGPGEMEVWLKRN